MGLELIDLVLVEAKQLVLCTILVYVGDIAIDIERIVIEIRNAMRKIGVELIEVYLIKSA